MQDKEIDEIKLNWQEKEKEGKEELLTENGGNRSVVGDQGNNLQTGEREREL